MSPTRKEKYEALMPGLRALAGGDPDFQASIGNLLAALKTEMDFLWIGLYHVAPSLHPGKGHTRELVLGSFQGPVACTRIAYGKGVCGACWERGEPIVVPDVHAFPGHIACSDRSRSEIVIPVFRNGEVHMVLDVDSESPAAFDDTDLRYLGEVAALIEQKL